MTRLHYAGIDVHKETMDVLVYRECTGSPGIGKNGVLS